jgi:2-polyprenyl-3-methyl-5-hydroxy-6-metoxy-1,4-benzoquinol methylase
MEMIIKQILEKCLYQYFPELNHQVDIKTSKTHSNSPEKLKCLHLPNLSGMSVLDVGCNFGYFSFQAAKQGSAQVIGIDPHLDNVNGAHALNENHYRLHNLCFKCCDFDDYAKIRANRTLDVIMALSVLHYFSCKIDFFEKSFWLLKPGGLLIIELPLTTLNTGKVCIHRVDNPNFPTQYIPNEGTLQLMYENWFDCIAKYDSNLKHRKVFHLKRKEIKSC